MWFRKKKNQITTPIRHDVQQVLDWFDQEFGRCKEYDFDCLQCRSMRLRDEIETYFNFIDVLEKNGLKKETVRPHRKGDPTCLCDECIDL